MPDSQETESGAYHNCGSFRFSMIIGGKALSLRVGECAVSSLGNSIEIQLTGAKSVKLEISKKRPGFDEALVRLSNLPPPLGKLVVEFTCARQKWAHLSELSEWMRAREEEAKRLEEEERQEAETLGLQLQSVLASPELCQQYQYLVKQAKILTSSEFLEQHSAEISLLKPLPEVPVVDLAPLRIVAAAHRSDRGVGAEDRAAIFKELPALGQLHSATVPSMMTDSQFWERCLKSRYFQVAAGKEVPPSHPEDRLFDALQGAEASSTPAKTILSHVEADLTGEFVPDRPLKKSRTGATLISRLNERSAGVAGTGLERSNQQESGTAVNLWQAVEKRRSELQSVTKTFEEDLSLATSAAPRPAQLQLKPGAGALSAMSNLPQKRERTDVTAQGSQVSVPQPAKQDGLISEAGTRWVLKHSTDELLMAERLLPPPGAGSGDAQAAPEPVVRAVTLLRHFWSSRAADKEIRAKFAEEAKNLLTVLGGISGGSGKHKAAMARSVVPPLRQALEFHARTTTAALVKRHTIASIGLLPQSTHDLCGNWQAFGSVCSGGTGLAS